MLGSGTTPAQTQGSVTSTAPANPADHLMAAFHVATAERTGVGTGHAAWQSASVQGAMSRTLGSGTLPAGSQSAWKLLLLACATVGRAGVAACTRAVQHTGAAVGQWTSVGSAHTLLPCLEAFVLFVKFLYWVLTVILNFW